MIDIKRNINKVRRSKDGKTLISNFAYLSLLQVIGYVFPLITLPYLARVIGIDSFGEIAFAHSIVVYFETFTTFGFNYTAVRDIAKNRDDINEVSRIFSNVMFAKVVLMVISSIIFSICVYTIPFLYEKKIILWLTFLYIPGHILFPDWLFQALEKMKYITIMNVLSKLVFTLLVFVIIREKSDYIYQPVLTAFGFFMSGVISLLFVYNKLGIKFIVPYFRDVWDTIIGSFNMFISLFLPNLYTNFSVTLLGIYEGSVATGIYSSGKRFVDLCDQITGVLSRTFFPFLARRIDKHNLYVKISGSLSIIMGILLFLGADLLIKVFYTSEFKDAAIILRIMSIAPFFLFLMNTYGPNYLVLKGKENILRNIIVFCSIGGFILAWIAISHLSYIGVAITVTVVWGIRGLLTLYYANRLKHNKDNILSQ
ncbi:flippase [Limibacterium fermenti]|uniref:flippase n=1 Tax=Limibacterium fermenti TaxID=3229863 RepID=UPI003A65D5C9